MDGAGQRDAKTLVVGYGNPCRRDDGAGCGVIEILAGRHGLPASLETMHQLDLTLAETICDYDRVIFVDARVCDTPEAWSSREVEAKTQDRGVTHFVTPADVLGLCRALYGHVPCGILFAIRGQDFGFGEGLSPETMQAALQVADRIEALVREDVPAAACGAFAGTGNEMAFADREREGRYEN